MRTAAVPGPRRTRGGGLLSLVVTLVVISELAGIVGIARGQEPAVPTVRDITVEGNRRVQAGAILARVQTKIGDPFSPSALRDDVRSIFALGFFDDVQVRTEEFEGGVRVIFAVVEQPILREVAFEGNREVKTEDLREKAALRVGGVYNPADVQKAEEAIRQKYEDDGYLGVTISPRTERTPEGDLRIVFRIDEGRKIYIDRIIIEGNQALSARQIKGTMETKEWYLWILPFSTLHRRVFEDDADRILNLYADHGYVQARIESQEILPDLQRGKVTLRIRVLEGPQFRTGTVAVKGNDVLSEADIRTLITLREGEVFNRGSVRNSLRAITDRYSDLGRAKAEVIPETENDPQKLLVNVTFSITEGPEVYVERINITGNVRSSEKVLRRELRLAEGDLFTAQKVASSQRRLFRLGYFDEVNISTQQGSTPERIIVNVEVKERATGVFSIGAGYSSLDGLFGTLDVTQRNLFGQGYEAKLQIRIGTKSRLGLIGFTDPYFLDTPLTAGFDVYDSLRDFDDFTEERLGGDIRLGYPLTDLIQIGGSYRLEEVTVTNVPDSASDDLKKELGAKLNSVIDVAIARDTRDNPFEPSSGSRNAVRVAFAGLGGDTQFYKVITESAWYFPLPVFNLVLGARGLLGIVQGWGGKEVPIFERFFLGGATDLRGFRTRSVAPKDAQGDVIGGDKEVLFSTELLIPVITRIRIALFFDAGNVYGFGTSFDPTNIRYDAGIGLRFFSPLGPLRLDYGFNLDRRAGEKSGQVQFTVGTPF